MLESKEQLILECFEELGKIEAPKQGVLTLRRFCPTLSDLEHEARLVPKHLPDAL